MKRLILIFLLALCLTACRAQPELPADTQPATAPAPAATEPAGLYDPDSAEEAATDGAVRSYPLGREDSTGIFPMGEDLILFSGEDTATLTKLSGENLYISAELRLDHPLSPEDPSVTVSTKGITLYDPNTRALMFLDTDLTDVSRTVLPEDIQGSPALSADRKHLYYCTADTLMVLDLETGLHKLLKEMFFPIQSVSGLHCNDTVVECDIVRNDGASLTYFFSADTGETLWEADEPLTLTTWGDRYFAARADGTFTELLTGTADVGPFALDFDPHARVLPLTGASWVLLMPEDGSIHLFDTESGKRIAHLEEPLDPRSACAAEDAVWLLSADTLYRWEPIPSGDETIYTGPRTTAENPDTEGLLRCRQMAEDISRAHQVDIRIWTDALEAESDAYTLTAEHRVSVLEESLQALDLALSRYPQGFLKEAAQGTGSGTARIHLVRDIAPTADAAPGDPAGIHLRTREEDFLVCLEAGADLEQELHRNLFRLLESRVISTCSAYDSWDTLNPQGFAYDYDGWRNTLREDTALTQGEDRAFVDIPSMSFPTEDRARIMACAMAEGNEALFAAPILQAKLRTLCEGIRTAFGLEDSGEPLPWEQYLT